MGECAAIVRADYSLTDLADGILCLILDSSRAPSANALKRQMRAARATSFSTHARRDRP